jgi:ATP adenylyltransferase
LGKTMSMDRLWAPWRLTYVAQNPPLKIDDDCFICRGLRENDDRRNQIVERTAKSVVLLNKFPYNNGHLLVAPILHKARLDELLPDELLEIMESVSRMVLLIEKRMKADGFNVGLNLGKAAGAGLPGHLHWHIVPRWNGDTNFMPVVADVKVIAQSLEALYDLLTTAPG